MTAGLRSVAGVRQRLADLLIARGRDRDLAERSAAVVKLFAQKLDKDTHKMMATVRAMMAENCAMVSIAPCCTSTGVHAASAQRVPPRTHTTGLAAAAGLESANVPIGELEIEVVTDYAAAVVNNLGGRGLFGVELFIRGDEVDRKSVV